jgi:hypothetical protein
MRLPTKAEALAITPWNKCGWPAGWYTWTSTEAGPSRWWYVNYDGVTSGNDFDGVDGTLCVR